MQQLPLAMRLREQARFDNFLPGPNMAALAGARAAAAGATGAWLLTGPAASGKSHLLLAALAQAQQSGRRTSYVAWRELMAARALDPGPYLGAQLLCCDDVDAVAGDREACRALFTLWVDADSRAASMLFTARELPAPENWALADLVSRLRGATRHQPLGLLDESDQRSVLARRARSYGLELDQEVLEFLWRRLPRDLGTLCQIIDELDRAALAAQRRLTVPFVRDVLMSRLGR